MSDYFNATGTIGFTCDVCGRELQGCTWVNGMRFCAKCYQETFGNTNPFEKELRDKIADLEAKLAEKEKEIKKLKEVVDCVDKLKQFNADMKDYALVNKDVAEEIYCEHQAKTDFAIEMLEKVKDDFFDVGNGWWLCFRDGTQYMTHNELEGCVRDVIDQQIKQLKEGK